MQLRNVFGKTVVNPPSILYPQYVVQHPLEPSEPPNPHLSDILGKSVNPHYVGGVKLSDPSRCAPDFRSPLKYRSP